MTGDPAVFTAEEIAQFNRDALAIVTAFDRVVAIVAAEFLKPNLMVNCGASYAAGSTLAARAVTKGFSRIPYCPVCDKTLVPTFGERVRCTVCNADLLPPEDA